MAKRIVINMNNISLIQNPLLSVPDNVKEKVYDDVAHPVAKEAGKSLETIGQVVNKFLFPLRKWASSGIENTKNLEENVNEKLSGVLTENIIAPPTYVAVPVIMANSYTDNVKLRELYAGLLAKSMNKIYTNSIHPSFVEVIKQLSPSEALFLKSSNILKRSSPSCQVRLQSKINNATVFLDADISLLHPKNIFSESTEGFVILSHYMSEDYFSNYFTNYKDLSFSIENLIRLNLIQANYTIHFTDISNYKDFYYDKSMKKLYDFLKTDSNRPDDFALRKLSHIPGILTPTDFGKRFFDICVS